MDPRISREPPVNPNLPAFTTANLETPRAKWTKSYESNRTAGDCRSESQLPLNSQESYKKNLENNGNKIAALVHVQRDPRLAPGSSQIKVAHKPEENARGVKRDRSEMGGIDETGNNCGVEREERTKRQRGECFRCGGRNHIVLVCTSTERDAYKNANLEKCGACNGRGHSPDNCPTIVNANPCYNCRQQGHFARDCPYNGNNQYHTKPKPLIYEYNNNNTMPLNQTIVSQLRQYGYSDPAQLYAALNVSNLSTGNVPVGPYPPSRGYVPEHPAPALNYEYKNAGYSTQFPQTGLRLRPARVFQKGKCFRCGREDGHWTRDCPQRPADADPNGCYKCGKKGHRSRFCKACYRCGGEDGHRASECPK